MKIQLEPPPTSDHVDAVRRAIDSIAPPPNLEEWYLSYSTTHSRRLAYDLSILDAYVPSATRIVEFGAVPPILTHAMAERSIEVVAVDIDPSRFSKAFASIRAKAVKCDIETEQVPLPDEHADAVVFNEIFEHLRLNPIFTMREVRRVLKNRGWLLLSTPNLRSLEGIRNFILRNRGSWCSGGIYDEYIKLETLGHMGHVREYTTREVVDFLNRIGFQVEVLVFRGGDRSWKRRAFSRVFPHFCPFVTIVAKKIE